MGAKERALIVGAGAGLSAALARLFASEGFEVALAARDKAKLAGLADETHAHLYACDARNSDQVAQLFSAIDADLGSLDIVVYNPSARMRGPIDELDPDKVAEALSVTCFGGFLVAREAARRMIVQGSGTILFTGASASVKGYANSSSFAMGKFGLRGLAQALARELQPSNIHVGHVVIDGGIRRPGDPRAAERGEDGLLEPDEIAKAYLFLHRQQRSAWTWELELRPWRETF